MASKVIKLIPGKTAFFVCDIQERFRPVIYGYNSVIETAKKMVKAAGLLDCQLVITEQNPRALGATVPLGIETLPSHLIPAWSPLSKTKFSMVLPEVLTSLKEWDTKTVVIFGIESHVCVLQTSLDLLELGYGVFILEDGVSSCNREEVNIALNRLRDAGAVVTSSESVLFQLMVDSNHPNFKLVSGLVKESKETTKKALAELSCGSTKL